MVLKGVSNPGWSFTNHRIEQLNQMLDWMTKYSSGEYISYQELQKRLAAEENSLDASSVRMLFPWLQNYGLLNEYNEKFLPAKIITDFGRQFTIFTRIYLDIIENEYKGLEKVSNDILKEFIFQTYLNLVGTIDPEENIYLQVFVFLKEFNKLTYFEFYLITTGIFDDEKDLDWTREMILRHRTNELKKMEPVKHKNAWAYITKYLEEADLITRDGDTIYPKGNGNYQKLIMGGIV